VKPVESVIAAKESEVEPKVEEKVEQVINKPINEVTFAPTPEFVKLSVKETQVV
jgi:hypothetical protein